MAAATGTAAWKITGDDRAKHDAQFFQLKPVNGFISGEQARGFFMQSGLPNGVLGQIWQLADMNSDGKMDKKEFSIAMFLIKKKLQGFELPKSLPASLKADPSPAMGSFGVPPSAPVAAPIMGMPVMGMAATSMTPSSMGMPIMTNGVPTMGQQGVMGMPVAVGVPGMMLDNKARSGSFGPQQPPSVQSQGSLAMPHASKLKYTQMFNTNDRNKRGHLTGVEARSLLVQSGLPQPVLAQIWTLSDYDKDGKLNCDEFCIAMHLSDVVKTGRPLPSVLPPELVPSKARSGSFGTLPPQPTPQAPAQQKPDAFGDLLGSMGMPPPQPIAPATTNGEEKQPEEDHLGYTFEDRRKQNFDKGQAELERRRQMLQDQMKRENEARMEKERQEQEKREKYRQEQERKRLAEMERQMEKQRQLEREREEQRQKMMEQREAARRELERQRQMEWERQRKEQLLSEKAREYEQLASVKSRASNLKCELESLQGKKTEIEQKISQVRNGVTDFTNSIEGMRITRDSKTSAIDRLQTEIQELSDKLVQVQSERESLNYRVQTSIQSNPLSDVHRTVLHSVELKKTAIQKLKKEMENLERETENKLLEIDKSNVDLSNTKAKLEDLELKMTSLKKEKEQKEERAQQQKQKLEEENRKKQQLEREKQERLREELKAQRLKEEQKQKEEKNFATSVSWAAFDDQTSNELSSAFSSLQSNNPQSNDIWGNAFSSQTTVSSSSKGCKYKALYPFEARNPDELSLNPDDIVWVPEDQTGAEEGWLGGEMNGKKGWFPKDYVEMVDDLSSQTQSLNDAFSSMSSAEPAFAAFTQPKEAFDKPVSDSPTPGQGMPAPDGLQAQALYPWKAKKDNHLSFNKGDVILVKEQQEMWWSGELNGQTGWFPKSYVKLIGGPASSKQSSRSGTPLSSGIGASIGLETTARDTPTIVEPTPQPEPFTALFTYTSKEPGDLIFNQGETVMVTKKEGDWWTGYIGDRSGIFPANYVKAAEQTLGLVNSQTLDSVNNQSLKFPSSDHLAATSPYGQNMKLENNTTDLSQSKQPATATSPFNPDPFSSPLTTENSSALDFDQSVFGDVDPFAPNAFSSDPFASEDPFSKDGELFQQSTAVTSHAGVVDLFQSSLSVTDKSDTFNVAISTQTSLDNSQNASADKTEMDIFDFDSKTALESVIRTHESTDATVRQTESFIELSQYFPDNSETKAPENSFSNKEEVQNKQDSDMFALSNQPKEVNADFASWDGSAQGNVDLLQGQVDVSFPSPAQNVAEAKNGVSELDDNFLQGLGQMKETRIPLTNSAVPGTDKSDENFSLMNSAVPNIDKSEENFSLMNSTLPGIDKPEENIFEQPLETKSLPHIPAEMKYGEEKLKLGEIKCHSANSSLDMYDDCSFDKNVEDNQEENEYDDLNEFLRPNDATTVNTNASFSKEAVHDEPDQARDEDYDDIPYLDQKDNSTNEAKDMSKSLDENLLNMIKSPPQKSSDMSVQVKDTEKSDKLGALDEDYDELLNVIRIPEQGGEGVSTQVKDTVSLGEEYDDLMGVIKSAPSPAQPEDKDTGNTYLDIEEHDQITEDSTKKQEGNLFEKFDSSKNLNKSSQAQNHPLALTEDKSDVDDLYEPLENFNDLVVESSVYLGEPSPSPVPQQSLQTSKVTQPASSPQKASSSSTLKKPEIASVIATYTATGPEQLSLQPGQVISVRKKSPSGWWEGELQARGQRKKIGWFPANYVKLLGGSSARSTPDTSSQSGSPANTLNRTATPTIPAPQPQMSAVSEKKYVDQVIALYPYSAQNDDELTFHKDSVINVINKDDVNWWQGEINNVVGMFPSNYVGPLTTSPPQENTWSSDPVVLSQTSAVESKRQNYIHELINTEESYMADMSIVLDAFHRPMADAQIMTQEELDTVFVNWKELTVSNNKLLRSLRVRKKMCGKGQVINVIGDILCENIPHMTSYIRFCSCQLNAAALIQRYTENSSEFREIQKKCVQDPRTKGMPLSSFLLKPMQRITKYPLMIQKILQYTPEEHPDYQNLEDALAKAEELCNQVNEGVRERENSDKLEWMQSHVICEGLPEKLVFNSVTNCLGPRKIIYYGTVYKVKGNKELVGFLFNDFLLLTTPLSSSTSSALFDPKTKAQFKMYKSPIFLNEIIARRLGEDDNDCLFQISHIDRVYNLKGTSLTERESWVRNLESASKLFLDTEKKKQEKAYSSVTRSHIVGRLLVIILEGISLAPTADVHRINGVGRLLVVILEGCDLQPSDFNGKSDPYCEVSMGVQEHKTKVINATLNPRWNSSMQFTIKDVEQDVLCITVFDRDLFSPNDFLGRTEMRVKEILNESANRKGPIIKRLLLHEVSSGEVVVKLDLQLYDNS